MKNDLKVLNEYPLELTKNRQAIEANVIACLWKNPDLYKDTSIVDKSDFITEDGLLFFSIGKQLSDIGYKVYDEVTLASYFADKPTLKTDFDNRGGYYGIKGFLDVINLDNTESYIDELIKNNILLRLHDEGFDIVNKLPQLNKLNSENVYKYFDGKLNDIFIKKQMGLNIFDLTKNYDDFLHKCDEGQNLGVSFGSSCPRLNYFFAGLHLKNVLLHTAHSGVGKTSSAIAWYVLPLLEQGEKVLILANEQDVNEWRSMLLPTIINMKLHHHGGFPRQRMQYGKFSESDWQILNEAKAWLEKYEKNLVFVELYDYSISTIKKVVGKYAKLGYTNVIYDTCKPEDESSDKAYAVFTENSKELFQMAKKENIVLILTAQLSLATINQRYLRADCLAKAKAIKEIAGQIVMIRNLWQDEYTGEKNDVRAYKNPKDEVTGKYLYNTKEYLTLDKNKQYALVFIDKNRFGKDDIVLLYEKSLDFNIWKELGICTPSMY